MKGLLTKIALAVVGLVLLGADVDPNEEFRLLLEWKKPAPYPRPMIEGMDADTLSALMDSGNLESGLRLRAAM